MSFHLIQKWNPQWLQRQGKCFILEIALLFNLFLLAFTADSVIDEPSLIDRVLMTVIALALLYSIGKNRNTILIGSLLLIPAMAHNWWVGHVQSDNIVLIRSGFALLFYLYTLLLLTRYVLSGPKATYDKIHGAISIYLLLGIIFMFVHTMVDIYNPGSYAIGGSTDAKPTTQDLLYFSYITLTTLGYGDILPVSQAARFVCMIEAIVGVLFTATFVARLIGKLEIEPTK